MKRQYDEVMEKIEVTNEMRGRILANIQKMDLQTTAASRIIPFPGIKKYLSIAACFAVLLCSVFAAGHMAGIFQSEEPNVAIANGIEEVDTLEELSTAVGFEVAELKLLPFEVEETSYVSYWNELAEIDYAGEGRTASFRKSPGTEDNSGDYNSYPDVKEINVGPLAVTLKGGGEVYTLATWLADRYAYSIRLSDGISESEWHALIYNSISPR